MTKADLVNAVVKSVEDLTKKKAADVVDALFEAVQDAMIKGEKVQIVGFGTFEVQQRAARKGRNPQDPQKEIDIPAKKVPVFRAGGEGRQARPGAATPERDAVPVRVVRAVACRDANEGAQGMKPAPVES